MNQDPALQTFLAESADLLIDMEAILLGCEQGVGSPEAVNELFRAAHTIKGSSGLFGLDAIVAFTHVVESVLDRARARDLPLEPELASVLLECRDHIKALVASVAADEEAPAQALTTAGERVLKRLDAQTGFVAAAAAATPKGIVPAPTVAAVDADSGIGPKVEADSWHISVRFHPDVLKHGLDPLSFIRYLTTFGSITGLQIVADALPDLAHFDAECCYLGFEIGLKTDAAKSRIEEAFEFVRDDCTLCILAPRSRMSHFVALIRDLPEADARLGEVLIACGSLTERELASCLQMQSAMGESEAVAPRLGDILVDQRVVQPALVTAAVEQQREAKASRDTKARDSRSIRVDGDKLDRLIDLIGELIIEGATTSTTARQSGLPLLTESAQRLDSIVEEVRDQALKLRMMQIGATFTRFQRVVRDVARESQKDISLELGGLETELDRTLVEGIADPLTHLVRNAIDHGIESPAVRLACGKSSTGVVRLNAFHDAGSVIIEVSDDGGGLKRERIVQKATERGLISPGQVLTDAQIFALIFEPGFSTAEKVTNLSGRGVGMDVVKRNITALRGTVEIDSREGQGTRIRIRLPLTLAIIDGFQVRVGAATFVLPLDQVEECIEVTSGAGHMNLRGLVLPLIDLRAMFCIDGQAGRRQSVVVVQSAGRRVGIVVDDLLGEMQAVIKPLSRLFNRLQGIGGSTILGNGKVALILDVAGLVECSLALSGKMNSTQDATARSIKSASARP